MSKKDLLVDLKIMDFIDRVASKTPSPGGGSVAALSGALGAGLIAMVCQLTIDKKNYEVVNEEMKKILKDVIEIKKKLLNLVDEDANAYNDVVTAFKLPKKTDNEKKIRDEAIQKSLKNAATVPLNCAKECQKILKHSKIVAEKGNVNAITDSGVAATMANSGVFGAALNVKINLFSIKDKEFNKEKEEELNDILLSSKNIIVEILNNPFQNP